MRVRAGVHAALGIIIALLLLLGVAVPSFAAGNKAEVSRAIAIAFDNSGSMYANGNEAWCRAQYAMEVFASMMNESDVLAVYPMCSITAGGKTYEGRLDANSYVNPPDVITPITLRSGDSPELLRDIFTPAGGGTPIETIDDAYNGLQKLQADEKWLIVLTDGTTFASTDHDEEYSEDETAVKITERLSAYGQNVNVLYLGIGKGAAMPGQVATARQFYADKAADSKEVLSKLTYMCNMIFGRDSMLVQTNAVFDVSMSKLIVFVQGSEISNLKLLDSTGKEIGKPVAVYTPRYSEKGCGNRNFGIDRKLSGMIVIYGPCEKGEYTLQYSGVASDDAQIYYEPDVDLAVQLVNDAGKVVEHEDNAYSGTYTLRYGLIDGRTGEMAESELLGNTHYDITYEINGTPYSVSTDEKNGEERITVNAGEKLDVTITATYLSGYTITKSTKDQSLPSPFDNSLTILPHPLGDLRLSVSGGKETYDLSSFSEEAVYTVTAYYKDQQLTGEALERIGIEADAGENKLGCKVLVNGDTILLSLDHPGNPTETACGAYCVTLNGTYANEDGIPVEGRSEPIYFTIEDDRFALQAVFDLEQHHYPSYGLKKGKPIRLRLTKDGSPLSAEELQQAAVAFDLGELEYTETILPDESAIELKLSENQKPSFGGHDLKASASLKDPFGETLHADAAASIQIQPYPAWVPWVLALLILAILALLIYLFLNAKVLPKKMYVYEARFSVGGRAVTIDPDSAYHKLGRREGRFSVMSPMHPNFPGVACAVDLTLTPHDKRIKAIRNKLMHGSSRTALITGVFASGNITNANLDSNMFAFRDGQPVEPDYDRCVITNDGECSIRGTVRTPTGNRTVLLSFKLVIK